MKNRKAFTLVELLVVIAIIAILAVAGVVGYMAFTKKAEVNNDTSLVAELNNYVAAASATDKINTPTDLRNILVDDGIDLATLKLSAAKQGYVPGYDIVAKKFVLIKDNALADGYTAAKNSDVFAFAKTEAEANALKAAGFSLYLQSGYDKETIAIEGLGLDVGENTGITTINYTGASSANDVVIRTNSQFTNLTIDGKSDHITHYGVGNFLTIDNVAPTSFHENGSWQKITLNDNDGKLVIESSSFVGEIVKNGGTLINNGVIAKEITGTAASTGISGSGTTGVTSSTVLQAGNAETLLNLAMAQSTGVFGNTSLKIEITSDIDITNKTWFPFGASETGTRFSGSIDGKGHKITGLSNGTYQGEMTANNNTPIVGDVYGFIAFVTDSVTVKNLKFDKVSIDSETAKECGVVIGRANRATNIELIDVDVLSGSMKCKDKAAGLIGYVKYDEPKDTTNTHLLNVSNCDVNIELNAIYGNGYRAGGMFGMISTSSEKYTITLKDCSFSGKINVGTENAEGQWLGGITCGLSYGSGSSLSVKNFQMNGTCENEASNTKSGQTRCDYLRDANGKLLITFSNNQNYALNDFGTKTAIQGNFNNVSLNTNTFKLNGYSFEAYAE